MRIVPKCFTSNILVRLKIGPNILSQGWREVRRGDLERAKSCDSIKPWPCNFLELSFRRGVTPSLRDRQRLGRFGNPEFDRAYSGHAPSMAIRSSGARCASLA